MNNYNYADEIIKDDDMQPQNYAGKPAPRKNILNSQDQNIFINATDVSEDVNDINIDPEEKIKSFEEGIRNDNINTEDNSDKAQD